MDDIIVIMEDDEYDALMIRLYLKRALAESVMSFTSLRSIREALYNLAW